MVNSESPEEKAEDHFGDMPYVELMEQAVELLEAGTLREEPAADIEFRTSVPQADDDEEPADVVAFPLRQD